MGLKLEVNHPDYPKGFEFDCDGILVENGSSVEITKEMEEAFLARNGRSIKDIYGKGEIVKLVTKSGGE